MARDEMEYQRNEAEANATRAYVVVWDNGHACGNLSGEYDTEEAAEAAGENWRVEMVAMDDDPAEAEEIYTFDVVAGWVVDGDFISDEDARERGLGDFTSPEDC